MPAAFFFSFHRTAWTALWVTTVWLWIVPAFGADVIYFKDGMRTACHGKAWEDKDEVHCEYDGGLLIYPKKDVARIEKGAPPANETESEGSQNQKLPAPQPATTAIQPPSAAPGPLPKPPSGILFYDPRRTQKYWSSATAQHESYPEALSALAAEFKRPVAWVEENMGESNDLREIRDVLTARSQAPALTSLVDNDPTPAGGVEFYNPRRPKKYWTSSHEHHDTLDQAIAAFAVEFGEPAEWIELHMGDVNDIEFIRRSLRQAQATDKRK